jgi:hypothetical protein
MSDILDSIKQKYSEEIGWSFSFFEGISFLLYLVCTYEVLNEVGSGIWKQILMKSASSIFISEESILSNARILDYLISALLTILTVYGYRKIRSYVYEYLCSLKNLKTYVDKLKQQYTGSASDNQAMRIYIANEAKQQKDIHMKRITVINGFGLVFLSMVVSSVIGTLALEWVDFCILIISLTGVLFIQWQVFTIYTAQVVPRLVLERVARGDSVEFGDELQ